MRKLWRSNSRDFEGELDFSISPVFPIRHRAQSPWVARGEGVSHPVPSETKAEETGGIAQGRASLQLCAVESGWAGFDVEDFGEST